jgi:glycosyltransferase involved in cell wall biosynthesis
VAAVSIITPAWNAAAYIEDTIASVRAQTFETGSG